MAELLRAARAAVMTPDRPFIQDAAIIHDQGRILEVGTYAALARGFSGPVRDLGEATVAPALINAHSHLEFSGLRGRAPSGRGFAAWVTGLMAAAGRGFDSEAVKSACLELADSGTAFVADTATRNAEAVAGILDDSGLFFVLFVEAVGHGPGRPYPADLLDRAWGRGRAAAAGHALYSTSPEALRRARDQSRRRGLPFSLHLAEHRDEENILLDGSGLFADILRDRGLLKGFVPPGKTPLAYALELGLLDPGVLAVHCVRLSRREVADLARTGASVCLCPRSNAFIGVGRAPWEDLVRAGVNVCLGTDSLASNTDLNLWNEARYLAERFDGPLDLAGALRLVTANPARALGLERDFGSLAPGKRALFSVVPEALSRALGRAA
ncbi:MAG: amidohydrolase family protein [Desulfovibrionaceae bacterium]|nr:amidohydrolase family protein [Desulfovibrionaceae bacterium]